jgi:hypothetical protein
MAISAQERRSPAARRIVKRPVHGKPSADLLFDKLLPLKANHD